MIQRRRGVLISRLLKYTNTLVLSTSSILTFDFSRIAFTAFVFNSSLMLLQDFNPSSNSFSRSSMFSSFSGLMYMGSQALNMSPASGLLVTIILTKAGSFKNLKTKYIPDVWYNFKALGDIKIMVYYSLFCQQLSHWTPSSVVVISLIQGVKQDDELIWSTS
jgi:hypothetical protein